MSCPICKVRKPRRYCPGIKADICAPCCGAEREVTISCPLDCEYLLEARRHEKIIPPAPEEIPNRDIRVTEEFLSQHSQLVALVFQVVLNAALKEPESSDRDVREALAALIQTHRTRQSGLIYEARPQNPYAARIMERVNALIEEFVEAQRRESGMTSIRDADLFGVLVFLERVAWTWDNKRPRGRSFMSFLMARSLESIEEVELEAKERPLILP